MHMKGIGGVFLFGGVGTLCRVGLQNLSIDFQWGDYIILILIQFLGSLLIGTLSMWIQNRLWKTVWTTGFCGGLTTVSGFLVQAMDVLQNAGGLIFLGYVLISVMGSILCCLFGMCVLSKKLRGLMC